MAYLNLLFSSSPSFGGFLTMRCLSCNCNLSDREANRKYDDWEQIKNPESRYIMLCDDCILDTDLLYEEDPNLSNDDLEDTEPIEVWDGPEDTV